MNRRAYFEDANTVRLCKWTLFSLILLVLTRPPLPRPFVARLFFLLADVNRGGVRFDPATHTPSLEKKNGCYNCCTMENFQSVQPSWQAGNRGNSNAGVDADEPTPDEVSVVQVLLGDLAVITLPVGCSFFFLPGTAPWLPISVF